LQPTKFLIDGIDRLGKSTLSQSILNELGYHLMIHYDKPKVLSAYTGQMDANAARGHFQKECNVNMFKLLATNIPIIFDRTHLGELVYAPMYRAYSGEYVYRMELDLMDRKPFTFKDDIRLILLTTSNFDIVTDDGQSFDFSKKEIEQQMFKAAFDKSYLIDKVLIDVHDGHGKFKSQKEILFEALRKQLTLKNRKAIIQLK
jgi:thymidylate kinase